MKTAFLFPGQGAQAVGMGAEIARAFGVAAQIYRKADDVIGFDLSRICFEGPAEKLNTTTISQPVIFVTSAAILEVLRTEPATCQIKPDVTAGLSLGEYTALYAADVISFEDALTLVAKRGQAMQAAAEMKEGAMVSIIGLDDDKVNQLCAEASERGLLQAVNFNCPGQIVVSGGKDACERAEKLAEKYGAVKAVRLEVAGAFHTEMMSTAADALKVALEKTELSEPSDVKIIANINSEYYKESSEIAQGLIKQLTNAIYWQKCMQKLIDESIENFYEIGPGRVLTGLMRRINRKTKVVNVSTLQAINQLTN